MRSMSRVALPIDDVIDDVRDAIRAGRDLVILAPPGAGKTTRVPAAVANEVKGRVLVLEPRRLAARLAAKRLAAELKTRLGDRVGYQVRFDDRTSKNTKIALLTEGILTRRMQTDPTLEDVGAVILDEFHERSVHADLAIAFLREVQETVRPDLRIVVMSATLDPARVLAFLDDAALVESDGRIFPVEHRYMEPSRGERPRLPDLVVSGVRRALRETSEGDVLAFLPGAGEIRRAMTILGGASIGAEVVPLYGDLDTKAQDRAVEPGSGRKVILSTNIAESSLTIPGVRVVVDGGHEKTLHHDPATGIDRLVLSRISLRSAAQRAGRAGRLGPGVAYRMWTDKEEIGFATDISPELSRIDLSRVVLDVLRWSASDPTKFGWFEAPPASTLSRAVTLLSSLGLVDGWRLTKRGEDLASLPLHPRIGSILAASAEGGFVDEGAWIAAVASERDFMRRRREAKTVGRSDLLLRVDAVRELEASGFPFHLADRMGADINGARSVARVRDRLVRLARRWSSTKREVGEDDLLRAILAGFPDRVGARGDKRFRFVGGGGGRLGPASVVRDSPFIVAVDVDASRGEPEIRMASAVDRSWLPTKTVQTASWNRNREAAEARVQTRYLDLVLDDRADPHGDPSALAAVLEEEARRDLERALPITDELGAYLARCAFLADSRPELADVLPTAATRAELLPGLVMGKKSFADLRRVNLVEAIRQQLPHDVRQTIDRDAPKTVRVPSGREAKLRYHPDGPPTCSVRLQEIFGLYETPRVGGQKIPIRMELLAPNMRPVQVTQDLASFWANTYADVRKDLRARYPKHQWPEDPRDGIASRRVRPRKKR